MKLIMIAALTDDRVIGNEGQMPWHIPEDLKRFRKLTEGHTVLMGRKTFESLPTDLPGREVAVLTRQTEQYGDLTFSEITEALKTLQDREKVFVAGGESIYSALIEFVDRLELTIVHEEHEGDTHFPRYRHLIGNVFALKNEVEKENCTFNTYVKG